MSRFARRIAWSLLVVWAVVSLSFALNDFLPGDPARMVAGVQARPADVARIREQLGLDRPPLVRYALFWRRLIHLAPRQTTPGSDLAHLSCAVVAPLGAWSVHVNLGKSYQLRQPVVVVVAARLPRTLALAFFGIVLQLLLGTLSGVFAAIRRGSWLDQTLVGVSLLGLSAPTFLVALALQYVFAYELGWLPIDGYGATFAEHGRCLVLPALTLGIYGAAYYARLVRDEMIIALRQDWVRTARAKGASAQRMISHHALRNILMPVLTAVAVDFGGLMGGAMVTETVFRWPGLGDLSVHAVFNRDGPVVTACVIVTAIAVVTSNLVVDLVYPKLDPRVR